MIFCCKILDKIELFGIVIGFNFYTMLREEAQPGGYVERGGGSPEVPVDPNFDDTTEYAGPLFELTSHVLGRGGEGQVCLATDVSKGGEGTNVAIKTLLETTPLEGRTMRRFRYSANIAKHLGDVSDFFPKVFEILDATGAIVMEVLEGSTLSKLLRDGRLTFDQKLEILRQIAKALSIAHEERIAVRDLKPGNVSIEVNGTGINNVRVKVLDFGIARYFEDQEMDWEVKENVIGTPHYMSPEAINNVVLPETDIYSLGVIAYELFSGQLPFDSNQPGADNRAHEICLQHLILQVPPLPDHLPNLLKQLIYKMLEKDPQDRLNAKQVAYVILEILFNRIHHEQDESHSGSIVRNGEIDVTSVDGPATIKSSQSYSWEQKTRSERSLQNPPILNT